MGSISMRRIGPVASAAGALTLLVASAMAQPGPATPTTNDPDRNSPAHHLSLDIHMIVRPDLTATVNSTTRFKILRESAIRALGQQSVPFVESLNPLEIVEAYTEKPDGRKLFVEAANILTRDAATGLNAVYQRDAKVKTIIFPDIEVGDTLVYVLKVNRIDKRLPGPLFFHAVLPRSVPYGTYHLTMDEPKSLGLRAAVSGEGFAHTVTEEGEGRR